MVKLINAYTLSECLEVMAEQIAAYEELGQKNIIFCEDRLTLVAERALMRRLGGTILSEITTFSRFLVTKEKVLSREGSVMAVGDIMLEKQKTGELKCFTSSASVLSGAKCIYEQLAQFAASELTPDGLKESVKLLPEDSLKNKMEDLALLYEEYDRFLRERAFLDEGKYLTLLPDCIKNAGGMSETNVFFLCYSSFTKQAKRTLAAAIESAKNVVGIFLAGDEEVYTNQSYGAFYELAKDYERQKRCVLKTQNFGRPLEGEAELLRKNLFAAEVLSDAKKGCRVKTDKVHIFAASDRASEAEYVAVYIRKQLQENPGLHYRDFAVLTPSVGEYALAIRKAFSEYGIPYSMDERVSLKQHPLAKFILAVMNAVVEGFTPALVDEIASNVFFGDGDYYRNYLLKYCNFRGGVFKEIKRFSDAKAQADFERAYGGDAYLKESKRKMETALGLFRGKKYGREYCHAIELLMEEFSAQSALDWLALKADDEGTRSYLMQIEKKLRNVLVEAELLAGGKEMSLQDFSTLLADGLEATEIAPNPLRLDAVFVGDLTDSRIERVNVLFALGMTDAVPRASDDANLITDQDKIKLQKIQAYLEPMVEEVNLRNREALALNLCTFTDNLYLSYALGSNGEDPALSDVFRYVRASFLDEKGGAIPIQKNIPEKDFAYRCSAIAPAKRQLLLQKNEYLTRATRDRKLFSSLQKAMEESGDVLVSTGSLEEEQQLENAGLQVNPYKTIQAGEELFLSNGIPSPSCLESYFDCPYKCFASKGLYLEERRESAVFVVDTGNFIHKLLEIVTPKISKYSDEEKFGVYVKEQGMSLMNNEKLLPKEDTLAGVYSAEKLLAEGVEVAKVVYRQITNSAFDTITTEKRVDTSVVRGKVDRVDENDRYVRVVDYKTETISAEPYNYYGGLKLQMQLYMSAVKGDKIPAGVFYFPASISFTKEADGKFRMKGFLNGDVDALRCGDTTLSGTEKSAYFDAALEKNRSSSVMPGDVFANFLDYALYVSKGASEELKKGNISASPVKVTRHDACASCKFGGMCGFHKEHLAVRSLPSVKPVEIAEIVKKRKEEEKE